jgi:uncharacterized protein
VEKIIQQIQEETGVTSRQIKTVVGLLDDGNTIPFIARYRKEMTGNLDENALRLIEERLKYHRNLQQRKEEVIRLIDEQGKLTSELQSQIEAATKMLEIDDIYLPYRPKRKTRASTARARGLQPLADYLWSFPTAGDPVEEATAYVGEEVPDAAAALQGAMDIAAEEVAENAEVRGWIRDFSRRNGIMQAKARDSEAESAYRMYYDYQEPVAKIPPHRILAINRAEREEVLKVNITVDTDRIMQYMGHRYLQAGVTSAYIEQALQDSYTRLIKPSIERDLRNELTEKAETHAIQIFARNLRSLLLQPPVKGQIVLGLDPAYRTGCKWTIIDDTGKVLDMGVVYPTPPQRKIKEAEQILTAKIQEYQVTAIAIGNGTASRETEQFVAAMIQNNQLPVAYTIVSEAGASVYSASKLAAQEFPDLDVSQRSAVSIARRVQDPLAELVKIEPRSIGVGQYQHDLPQKELNDKLTIVVESAVNQVGVELNSASAPLLAYVAGVSATVAQNIVKHRDQEGKFRNRKQLLKVARLGPATFQQAAGFLRIYAGDNPLDATAIHPESYEVALKLLEMVGANPEDIGTPAMVSQLNSLKVSELAHSLEVGEPTLKDVIEALQKPHRDPRDELPPPVFRTDVLSIEDLSPGMTLHGTVRNVVDFGAFVDIGIKNDGLVHISELADRYVRHPMEVVSIGDQVTVKVLSIDRDRGKVSLSMKN